MTARIRLAASTAVALLAIVLFVVTLPPAPIGLGSGPDGRTVRGAFHIHTTGSDGALDKRAVAAAAGRAGLQFAIFTDHGDGTRVPDTPEYVDRVLCIDAVEISTNDGHYVALDMAASPYPLAGDADAVAEDVARLGGFGVAAHPTSPREELAWSAWDVPIDGLEWLNADSEWRDETRLRLLGAFLHYPWRPAGALASLLDRPQSALAMWDSLAATRPIVALAGQDAHGGFGAETDGSAPGRRLHIPSYGASFRTFSVYATLATAFTGEADRDAAVLLDAIRGGRVFTGVDAFAGPASLDFHATAVAGQAQMGDLLPMDAGPARFSVRAAAPDGATTILRRDGRAIATIGGGVLDHDDDSPGVYRVEVHLPGARGTPPVPWLLSNPIYRFRPTAPAEPQPPTMVRGSTAPITAWRVERSAGSSGRTSGEGTAVSLFYDLPADAAPSPFVALSAPLEAIPEGANRIVFRGRAARPTRVSVQLRFGHDEARWRRSVYIGTSEREITVPIGSLRPAGQAGRMPPVSAATSLLFVVDLTNARPGEQGSFTVADVALQDAGI